MNYWPLLGIVVVVIGFVLRLNPALVVVGAGIATGLLAGKTPLMSPNDAAARPNGIALGPDGSLYITESVKGKTWRVMPKK